MKMFTGNFFAFKKAPIITYAIRLRDTAMLSLTRRIDDCMMCDCCYSVRRWLERIRPHRLHGSVHLSPRRGLHLDTGVSWDFDLHGKWWTRYCRPCARFYFR